jgi:hypothetical protein
MADDTTTVISGSHTPATGEPLVQSSTGDESGADSAPLGGVPTRSPKGQFLPGDKWEGNAKGRAKGVKNRITLQRLLVEERLRDKLNIKAEDILAQAVEMAMGGNDKIMRTLLDKLLATPKNSEDGDAKDNSVSITINDLSGSAPKPVATVSRGAQTLTIPRVTSTEAGDSDNG